MEGKHLDHFLEKFIFGYVSERLFALNLYQIKDYTISFKIKKIVPTVLF